MGKKEIITQTRISTKKKRWYNVLAPKEFNSVPFGETPAETPEKLKGRALIADLGLIMENQKRQGASFALRITGLDDGGNAGTEIEKYYLSNSNVRRLAKKGREKMDFSFTAQSKDNLTIRIKPLIIGRTKIPRSKQGAIKKEVEKTIQSFCKEKTFSEFILGTINNEVQKKIRSATKNICFLPVCEIRAVEKV